MTITFQVPQRRNFLRSGASVMLSRFCCMELVSYIISYGAGRAVRRGLFQEAAAFRSLASTSPASGVVCQTFLTICVISVLCAVTRRCCHRCNYKRQQCNYSKICTLWNHRDLCFFGQFSLNLSFGLILDLKADICFVSWLPPVFMIHIVGRRPLLQARM